MQQADTGTKMIHLGKNTKVQLFQKVFQLEIVHNPTEVKLE